MIDLDAWETEAITKTGMLVRIRPLRPDDFDDLRAFTDRLSDESRYMRFFSSHSPDDDEIRRLVELDYRERFAFVAKREDSIVGVGQYILTDRADTAEVAFAVADNMQGLGIGTLLLEHLRAVAKTHGITRFVADVLGTNRSMMTVFGQAGYQMTRTMDQGVWEVELDVTDDARSAVEAREQLGEAASIARLLRPRGVAVIGASRRAGTIGNALLRNILESEFQGVVHPVNPNATSVLGVKAYPSISDIPDPIDLAIIAVPASAAPEVLRECGRKGVSSAVVITAGFAEVGGEGSVAQRELLAIARHHGIRIVGPNCMGVVNTEPDVQLNATFAPVRPERGRVGFVSQSGALGIAILAAANDLGIGISSFLSVGNKADVSGNDILQFWETDPETDIGLLYLESFGNPRKFARLARRFTRTKPLVVVKSGRSTSGARGASSHTAAMASSDVLSRTLFRQAGIIRVDTLEQLFNVARVLSSQPIPTGRRVAIVGNSGGPGILTADACEGAGLEVPELSPETQQALRAVLPAGAGVSNPVDVVADSGPDEYRAALDVVLADPAIDAVIVIYTDPLVSDPVAVSAAIAEAVAAGPLKPVLATYLSVETGPMLEVTDGEGNRRDIPIFPFPEAPAVALGRITDLGVWRQRDPGRVPIPEGIDIHAARSLVDDVLAESPEGRWLDTREVVDLFASAGIHMVPTAQVTTPEEAARLALEWDRPVALKVQSSTILHKSDVGGVLLGVAPGNVADVATGMVERFGDACEGIVVQAMADPGTEVIVGVVNDPAFGPLVMFGMGGTATELFEDVDYRIVPLTDVDAEEMIQAPKSSALLRGYRGAPLADRAALVDLLIRVSTLADLLPQLAEVDMNPVIVGPEGISIVDGRARIAPAVEPADLPLRRMRR